jgi:hypothetical protein
LFSLRIEMSGETLLLSGSSLAVGRDSGNNQNDESSHGSSAIDWPYNIGQWRRVRVVAIIAVTAEKAAEPAATATHPAATIRAAATPMAIEGLIGVARTRTAVLRAALRALRSLNRTTTQVPTPAPDRRARPAETGPATLNTSKRSLCRVVNVHKL